MKLNSSKESVDVFSVKICEVSAKKLLFSFISELPCPAKSGKNLSTLKLSSSDSDKSFPETFNLFPPWFWKLNS